MRHKRQLHKKQRFYAEAVADAAVVATVVAATDEVGVAVALTVELAVVVGQKPALM